MTRMSSEDGEGGNSAEMSLRQFELCTWLEKSGAPLRTCDGTELVVTDMIGDLALLRCGAEKVAVDVAIIGRKVEGGVRESNL